jgi:hypothetical protein
MSTQSNAQKKNAFYLFTYRLNFAAKIADSASASFSEITSAYTTAESLKSEGACDESTRLGSETEPFATFAELLKQLQRIFDFSVHRIQQVDNEVRQK